MYELKFYHKKKYLGSVCLRKILKSPDNVSFMIFGDIFKLLLTQAKTPDLFMINQPVS